MFGGINNIYMGGYKFSAHCTNISAHKIYSRASLFISGEYFLDRTAIDNQHRKRTPVWEGVHKLEVSCIQNDRFLVCNHLPHGAIVELCSTIMSFENTITLLCGGWCHFQAEHWSSIYRTRKGHRSFMSTSRTPRMQGNGVGS